MWRFGLRPSSDWNNIYKLKNKTLKILGFLTFYAALVDKQFDKAISIERSELLKKKAEPVKRVFPLVLDYNPILPDNYNYIYIFLILYIYMQICKLTRILNVLILTCKYCSNLKKAEGRNVTFKAGTVRSLLHDASSYT